MFQFSETSSLKSTLASLVMLFTMEDRRRRLEDAEDSLVPENKEKLTVDFLFISLFVVDCKHRFDRRTFSLVHHCCSGMIGRGRPRL